MTNVPSAVAALTGLALAAVLVAEAPAFLSFALATAAALTWCWWIDER
jgi:hypothetical protein